MIELLPLFILPFLVCLGAAHDVHNLTIPNWISGCLILFFFLLAFLLGLPWSSIGGHLAFGAGILAIGIVLFAVGGFGGGDAKLLAATSLWMGLSNGLSFLLMVAIAGGGLTLVILLLRRMPVLNWQSVNRVVLHLQYSANKGVPYGVAIAAGALITYPSTDLFQTLTG